MSSAAAVLDRPVNHEYFLDPLEQDPTDRLVVTLDPDYPIEGFGETDFAIDEAGTYRPEDALSGVQNPACDRPAARRTLVDPGIDDPDYDDINRIMDALDRGDFRDVEMLVDDARRPHYRGSSRVRSIVTPFCRSKTKKLVSPGPHMEAVMARQFIPSSLKLHGSNRYVIAERLAHRVVRHDYPNQSPDLDHRFDARQERARRTVRFVALASNIVLTEWARQYEIPQIVKSKPEQVATDSGIAFMSRYITSAELDHDELVRFPATHSGIGSRDKRLAGVINSAQIASSLKDDEPAFDEETIRSFADLLTRFKAHRRSLN